MSYATNRNFYFPSCVKKVSNLSLNATDFLDCGTFIGRSAASSHILICIH
jgi:hypothetical protein